jgi:hypothetical protein
VLLQDEGDGWYRLGSLDAWPTAAGVWAIFLVVFNIAGLPYPGAYDNLLILVSLVFNALTAWYAWNWLT